jgi:hypothetical protein
MKNILKKLDAEEISNKKQEAASQEVNQNPST